MSSSLFAQGNDYIEDALLMDDCTQVFSANNTGYTDAYNATTAGCGSGYENDLDCDGDDDVTWSIENDIWFHFCPGNNGDWTIDIDQVSCNTTKGYQLFIGQGDPTSLTTLLTDCGSCKPSGAITGTYQTTLTITDYTAGCVYIGIDGYGGTICDFQITLSNPAACTFLANSILNITGETNNGCNVISWSGEDESESEGYLVYRSNDMVSWDLLDRIDPRYGEGLYKYKDCIDQSYYYKVASIDFNGLIEDSRSIYITADGTKEVLSTRYYDVFGKEYSRNSLPAGMVLYVTEYDDGTFDSKKRVILE